MSAIAGIYNLYGEPVSPEHSNSIMKDLERFPANDIQTLQKGNIFLGCHAQWITPESVGEKLPYFDYERQLAITSDAIIDNREELFERLQIEKAKQKSMSDSELILLSYHKWEEECPKFLIGDFAFMIWDERKQKLFGARDFSGARTLYFYSDESRFAFCTIIKPLFNLPYIDKKLNEEWLAEFLAIPGMIDAVNTSTTVYKKIEQIPPSHSISVVASNITYKRYCSLNTVKPLKLKSNQEYEEVFRDVFQTAVNSRLRTHLKVGAHLSGGLDSGSIVSFAAKSLRSENKKLHTFSYVPSNDFIDWTPKRRMADERPYIKSTVDYVGNIDDHYLDFKDKSPFSEIDDWLDTLEIPYKFFENSFWLKGIYEYANSKNIGIILNGGRGNWSISWGSALEYYADLLRKMRWIRLYSEINQYSTKIGTKKSRIFSVIGKKAYPFLKGKSSLNDSFSVPTLINTDFAQRIDVFSKLKEQGIDVTESFIPNKDNTRKMHFENLYSWNNSGTSGTKSSLQYSLWDRDPTNDLRVIRLCLSLPIEQYVQGGLDRALIRRSTENFLPDKVRLNQTIRGIQGADGIHRMIPTWDSFIGELNEMANDNIIKEYLNVDSIKSSISKFKEGPKTQMVYDNEFRILMRGLIVYRFIKKLA